MDSAPPAPQQSPSGRTENEKSASPVRTELQDVVKRQSDIIDALKEKVRALTDEEARLRGIIEQHEKRAVDSSGVQRLQQQVRDLQGAVADRDAQIESLQQGTESLSQLVERYQQNEGQIARQYDAEIKKLRAQGAQQKEQLDALRAVDAEKSALQDRLDAATRQIESLTQKTRDDEIALLRTREEVAALQRTSRAYNSEALIDKRVISNILVQYLDMQCTTEKRLQILETLASMLNFSESETEKIGLRKHLLRNELKRQASGEGTASGKKSISEAFFDFISGKEDFSHEEQKETDAGDAKTDDA